MSEWQRDLERESKAHAKRWNGKVITTARQWSNNADGAMAIPTYNNTQMWEAVRDYYNTREWN